MTTSVCTEHLQKHIWDCNAAVQWPECALFKITVKKSLTFTIWIMCSVTSETGIQENELICNYFDNQSQSTNKLIHYSGLESLPPK